MVMSYGIGLVGWGTVGGGVLEILHQDGRLLEERCGMQVSCRAIVTKHPQRPRPTEQAPGNAVVSDDLNVIISDPQIHTVLHLVGGLEEAYDIAARCLRAGKHVVTANKALLAERGHDLFHIARQHQVCIAFEASVAGGIPVIASLRDGFVANKIISLHAILNGTCNYVLTQMEQFDLGFEEAVAAAKELGYAEADPTLDIDGTDSAHKLAILARIAFSTTVQFSDISVEGIQNITDEDMASAKRLGCRIKLLAVAARRDKGLELRVAPTLIPLNHPLANVPANYNGVLIDGHAAGPNLLVGQGAGALPTASAVIADLVGIASGAYQDTANHFTFFEPSYNVPVVSEREEVTGSYGRFTVPDRPGILAGISACFAERGISIQSIRQDRPAENDRAILETITHPCPGGDFLDAVQAMQKQGLLVENPVLWRRIPQDL